MYERFERGRVDMVLADHGAPMFSNRAKSITR